MKYKYNGQWYDLSCSLNVSNLLIGEIIEYAGESIPGGYLVCDGSAISRTEYSELFDVIGTLYGSGNGSTTFNLPDLRGKVVTGLNTTNSNFNVLGKTGGEETHTLTISEMPSHTHKPSTSQYGQFTVHSTNTAYGTPDLAGGSQAYNAYVNETQPTGGGQAHNNLQPYITINYLIRAKKTKNVLASGSTVVNSLSGDSTVDAPSVRAVKSGIMESGSNDNGNYIKFYDGTMICYETISKTVSLTDYWGQLKKGLTSITFSQKFISIPLVNVGLVDAEKLAQLSISADSINTSGFTAIVFKPNAATNTGIKFSYIAIGKWK